MKTTYAYLAVPVLGFLIAQSYVGLGLSGQLTAAAQTMLGCALAATCVGFFAGIKQRWIFAMACWGLAGTVLLGLQLADQWRLRETHAKTRQANRSENALLLAKAIARVPCGNGDVATLQMLNNPNTQRYSLSIQIVPAQAEDKAYILVSTSGEYKPPSNDAIRRYQAQTMTDCQSQEYASLSAMMQALNAHYAAERHKYSK